MDDDSKQHFALEKKSVSGLRKRQSGQDLLNEVIRQSVGAQSDIEESKASQSQGRLSKLPPRAPTNMEESKDRNFRSENSQ